MSDLKSPKEHLLEREMWFDQKIERLKSLELPVRVTIAALHASVDSLRFGNRLDPNAKGNIGKFIAACGRIGHIITLLKSSPLEPIGANAQDAIVTFYQAYSADLSDLLLYAHLCELMPEVHRGNFDIQEVDSNTFRLFHSAPETYDSEAQDIIWADLAVPFLKVGNSRDLRAHYTELADKLPRIDLGHLVAMVRTESSEFKKRLVEAQLMDDDSMQRHLGFNFRQFQDFCASVAALAEVYSNIGLAFTAKIVAENLQSDPGANAELLEWISALQRRNFIQGMLLTSSGLDASVFDRIFQFFSMDLSRFEESKLKDGFSPSFLLLGDSLLFCPASLPMNLSFRNILFVLNRDDPSWFSANLSKYLEPCLISQAMAEVSKIPGIVCHANVDYPGGEIDLILYSEKDRVCAHVQAKAPIAPQGAKMVKAVQDRMLEGISQINKFNILDRQVRAEIVSRVLNREVKIDDFKSALLVRGSVGTKKVWKALTDEKIDVLNLSILRWAALELRKSSQPVSVTELFNLVRLKTDEIRTSCAWTWTEDSIEFGGTKIIFPSLHYDRNEFLKIRTKIFDEAV